MNEDSEVDRQLRHLRDEYALSIDFAFFVVNYGYSKSEYEELTPMDRVFIRKAHEDKVVSESQMMSTAVTNAIGNAWRKKNQEVEPLWKKKQKKLNKEIAFDTLEKVLEVEENEGKGWLDILYAKNGMKKPRRDRTVDKVNRLNRKVHENENKPPESHFHSVYKGRGEKEEKDVEKDIIDE